MSDETETENKQFNNGKDSIKEIIEAENIKLELDKAKTDEVNIIYNATVEYDEFTEWAKTQTIVKGFRQGVIPLTDEYKSKFLNITLKKIKEQFNIENLFSINYIETVFKEKMPIKLIVIVEKMPEIPDIDFSNYSIKKYESIINNEDVKKAIETFANTNATPSKLIIDAPAKSGDFIKLEITDIISAKKEIQEIRLGYLMLNPDLESKLIDQRANFTTLYKISDKMSFEIKILEVKEANIISKEDIAKKINVEKVEEIENKFQEELEIRAKQISKDLIIESILKIISELKFLIPASILNAEYKNIHSQVLFDLKYDQQMNLESFIQERLNIPLSKFEDQLKIRAVFNAKIKLFLSHFAFKNNIEASKEETSATIEARSKYFQNGLQEAQEYFNKNEEAMNNLKEQIIRQKTLEHIQDKIKFEEILTISIEELEKFNINELTYTNTTKN